MLPWGFSWRFRRKVFTTCRFATHCAPNCHEMRSTCKIPRQPPENNFKNPGGKIFVTRATKILPAPGGAGGGQAACSSPSCVATLQPSEAERGQPRLRRAGSEWQPAKPQPAVAGGGWSPFSASVSPPRGVRKTVTVLPRSAPFNSSGLGACEPRQAVGARCNTNVRVHLPAHRRRSSATRCWKTVTETNPTC